MRRFSNNAVNLTSSSTAMRFASSSGKDIKYGVDCRRSILKGVDRISQAVAVTLGPKGRNVVMEQAYGAPKITKDGVTVAKSIEFKDSFENLGAQLIRQVANKTNDVAGDGTTTAVVLARSIFMEGFKTVSTGTNPVDMKRGIDRAVEVLIQAITAQSRAVSKPEEIVQVATISANGDKEIGRLIGMAIEKVGKEGVITTQDGKTLDTELEVIEGMSIDRGYISPYFVTDSKTQRVEYEDALVLICSKKISNLQMILPLLNHVARAGKPLLIIADDIDGEALAAIILNKLHGKLKVVAVKAPGFGDNKTRSLEDLAVFTGGKLVSDDTGVTLDRDQFDDSILGSIKKVTVNKDQSILLNGGGDAAAIQERVELIKAQISESTSEYDKEKMQERLAKLSGGVAVIRVGGASELEVGERKDRITDALCATRAAVAEGIVAGGGTAILVASKALDALLKDETLTLDQRAGVQIVKSAVRLPCSLIASNAGKEGSVIVEAILSKGDATYGYDAALDRFGNMFEAGIIDPTKVVKSSLLDASSVAGLLITTEAAICDIPKKETASAGGMGGGMGGMGGMDY